MTLKYSSSSISSRQQQAASGLFSTLSRAHSANLIVGDPKQILFYIEFYASYTRVWKIAERRSDRIRVCKAVIFVG